MNTTQKKTKNAAPDPKMIEEVYYSVDIEADGPIPGPYSMSSIGVVASAYRTKDGTIVKLDLDAEENCFYAELQPISKEFIPEAMAVSGLDRDELVRNGQNPTTAMMDLNTFIKNRNAELRPEARPIFAGYPLGFDWLFTYWYLLNFIRESPFGHSSHLDMKSFYASAADVPVRKIGKRSLPPELRSNRKHSHNALDDAREQGELLQNLLVWKSNKN